MVVNATNATKRQKLLEAFKLAKSNISKACEAVNIDRATFYRWQEKYPKFAEQIKEIEDSLTDNIEIMLMRKAEQGHQRAMEFYLTNRKKDKYNNNQQLEVIMPKVVKETVFVQSGEPPKIVEEEPKDPEN
jgi:L-lactate utilization protein LutB